MIDLKFLRKLLDLLNETDADTIEIRKWPWSTSVKVSRNSGIPHGTPVTYQVAAPGQQVPAQVASPEPAESPDSGGGEQPATELLEIKSPMVGTFYAQPEPGADAYVHVGDRIKVGQTLCIIEAMKIMNPLDSEVSGVIREICVEDAQPVEFGHVLFRVDPNG